MTELTHEIAGLSKFVEGQDFCVRAVARNHPVLVLAIHGGYIEPFTSQLAEAIAGDEFSLYDFRGLREAIRHELHIVSARFSDPQLTRLIAAGSVAVSVHGKKGDDISVGVGGLNLALRQRVEVRLQSSRFDVQDPGPGLRGVNPENVVNRPKHCGVQLEISNGLRIALARSMLRQPRKDLFISFVDAIRVAVFEYLSEAAIN